MSKIRNPEGVKRIPGFCIALQSRNALHSFRATNYTVAVLSKAANE